jgi:hypothetical protein
LKLEFYLSTCAREAQIDLATISAFGAARARRAEQIGSGPQACQTAHEAEEIAERQAVPGLRQRDKNLRAVPAEESGTARKACATEKNFPQLCHASPPAFFGAWRPSAKTHVEQCGP